VCARRGGALRRSGHCSKIVSLIAAVSVLLAELFSVLLALVLFCFLLLVGAATDTSTPWWFVISNA